MVNKRDTYDLGIYEKAFPNDLNWDQRFESLKKMNFDFLELSIDESNERLKRLSSRKLQNEIKEASSRHGVPIRSICLSAHRRFPFGSHKIETRTHALDIFIKAVDLANYLGIRIIQLAGYDVYYEKSDVLSKKFFIEGMTKALSYAAQNGVLCGFESMETEFMNTIEKIMVYINLFKSPYCQIYPDLGNLSNANRSTPELIEDLRLGTGHLIAAHLKETRPQEFRKVPFGTGNVNFSEGIRVLWNLGVRSFVCECWYEEGQDYEKVLVENQRFLRKHLDVNGGRHENRIQTP